MKSLRALDAALSMSGQQIFDVAIGALIFSNFVNLAGFTHSISTFLGGMHLSAIWIVMAICVIYLAMG